MMHGSVEPVTSALPMLSSAYSLVHAGVISL
jgi:hypothetical protein